MTTNFRAEAQRLAARRYTEVIVRDTSTENEPLYFGRVMELQGCYGQGLTLKEAQADLQKAKVDYIESLLEDGLTVPIPKLRIFVPRAEYPSGLRAEVIPVGV